MRTDFDQNAIRDALSSSIEHGFVKDAFFDDPPAWFPGDGTLETIHIEGEEVGFLQTPLGLVNELDEYSLPTEFFHHDLLLINTQRDRDILRFSKKYGLMFHPKRYAETSEYKYLVFEEADEAIELTDKIAACKKASFDSSDPFVKHDWEFKNYVSLDEMRYAISALQDVVIIMFALIDKTFEITTTPYPFLFNLYGEAQIAQLAYECCDLVHKTAGNSKRIGFHWSEPSIIHPARGQKGFGSLSSAICSQIIETFSSKAEWKTCEYCGIPYKFQLEYSRREAVARDKQRSSAKYCCKKCRQGMGDVRGGRRSIPSSWTAEKIASVCRGGLLSSQEMKKRPEEGRLTFKLISDDSKYWGKLTN